jgi:hypothetical protein
MKEKMKMEKEMRKRKKCEQPFECRKRGARLYN